MARKHSKRYRQAISRAPEAGTSVSVKEAVERVKSMDSVKFDETVEVALKLGIDPRKADQLVRGSISLPHGLGKEKRVIAFVDGDEAQAARDAGAIEVGTEDLVKKIQGGWFEFDVAIAHPTTMRFVGRLGRVLGPKGIMPSPKSGTVTDDVPRAVREFSLGKIEYRNDSGGNIHAPVGRKSFPADKLVENIEAFVDHIKSIRPSAAKGVYIQNAAVSSTMGAGVKLAVTN